MTNDEGMTKLETQNSIAEAGDVQALEVSDPFDLFKNLLRPKDE